MTESSLPPRSRGSRFAGLAWRFFARAGERLTAYRHELVIFALIAAAGVVFLLPSSWNTIPAGHVGVLWKRFAGGTVTDQSFAEGTKLILPWDRLYVYDARLQQVQDEVQVLAADGLQMTLTVAWRYHLESTTVAMLHKFVGPNYGAILVTPTVSSRARDVIATYRPEEVYTENRLKIQNEILESVRFELDNRFSPSGSGKVIWLNMEDILIKAIALPPGVQEAIVRKNSAFHEIEEFAFRAQKEEKEAERKRIEAMGIRNFQEIVSNGMSDSYLRWRGIEATLELAKSPNAKVLVIGNNKNGLPLILNMDSKDTGELPFADPGLKPKPVLKSEPKPAARSESKSDPRPGPASDAKAQPPLAGN